MRRTFTWLLFALFIGATAFAQSSTTATIRVDIAELGRRAFALLLDALGGQNHHQHRQECIGTTLVVRKSSAPLRARKKGEIS